MLAGLPRYSVGRLGCSGKSEGILEGEDFGLSVKGEEGAWKLLRPSEGAERAPAFGDVSPGAGW